MQKKQLRLIKKIATTVVVFLSIGAIAFFVPKKLYTESSGFTDSVFSDKYFVRGVDLSHHNPIIDWRMAASENITFVYLKATEGTNHIDRNYADNYQSARKNKLKVGTYHFYTFGISGKAQANHFIRNANCQSGDIFPAIDVEHSTINRYKNDANYIALVIKELKVLENELYKNYGFRPIIYTNRDCYKLYIKKDFPNNPIWMCDLQNEPSDKEIKNWVFWQFSHKGKLGDVRSDIDLNYFRYGFDELQKYVLP